MILVNYLATALPINGKNTGELSDQYPNLFVPVGLTFSIWGLIYLLLMMYCVSQFFLKSQLITTSLGRLFMISCFLNVGWILAWHYELIAVSVVLMLGLLFILIRINKAILVKEETVMKAAFGIYMGWIFIATIANITALLVSIGWNGLGIPPDKWAIAMMTTGALLTIFSIAIFRNIYLAIPVVWAFIGIILKRQQDH